jgi:hypothetical protein
MLYVYPFLLRVCKRRWGGNKTYNFCFATCNEACLGYMGIVAIGPFNLWDNGYLCKKTITGIWGIQIDI